MLSSYFFGAIIYTSYTNEYNSMTGRATEIIVCQNEKMGS